MKRLVVMLVCVLAVVGAKAQQIVPQLSTIVVTGEAKRSVTPDRFTIALTLMEGDGKNDKLSIVEKHKKLTSALKAVGIDPSALKTDDISNSRYKRKDTRVTVAYELRVEGFNNVARAFDAIAAAGVRVANLVESKCSNEAAIREELMAEAVRNARRMADVLAEAAGVEVNSVHSIEMPSVRTYYGTVRAMSFKSANDAVVEESLSALNLEVRDVEMSASVNVVYGFVAKEK